MSRMTKKDRRRLRQEGVLDENADFNPKGFALKKIKPLTEAQKSSFDHWRAGHNLLMHGVAGTGKSYLALYFALNDVFSINLYKKVFIIRSAVSGRDIGFQPGTKQQKEAVYESPYIHICNQLFGRGDAYNLLKQKNVLEFMSTSFLRGLTFDDCVVVVDEVQNMSDQELHTIMTRVGHNCRIIFCGDLRQDDLTSKRFQEESGLKTFMRIINNMEEFKSVNFQIDDIVRSDLIKSYIMERYKLGY